MNAFNLLRESRYNRMDRDSGYLCRFPSSFSNNINRPWIRYTLQMIKAYANVIDLNTVPGNEPSKGTR
jgi:hypothetical protein